MTEEAKEEAVEEEATEEEEEVEVDFIFFKVKGMSFYQPVSRRARKLLSWNGDYAESFGYGYPEKYVPAEVVFFGWTEKQIEVPEEVEKIIKEREENWETIRKELGI